MDPLTFSGNFLRKRHTVVTEITFTYGGGPTGRRMKVLRSFHEMVGPYLDESY